MSSDPIEVLRELPELWRESAIGWDKLESGQDASRWLRTCADELESALASLAAPKPDGEWVLVPREPSEAMLDAGKRCVTPLYVYDAMLAAAPKPPPMNDNAVAVNESAPVNDKPESAEAVCPECQGNGQTPEVGVAFGAPVICPDCAGSGRAEHSITANESAPPRPEASAPDATSVAVDGAMVGWSLRHEGRMIRVIGPDGRSYAAVDPSLAGKQQGGES